MKMNIIAQTLEGRIIEIEPQNFVLEKSANFPEYVPNNSVIDRLNDKLFELTSKFYDYLDSIHKFSTSFKNFDNGNEDLYDFLEDLLTNAELHGNKFDKTKKTYFSYNVRDYGKNAILFTFIVKDEGEGFNFSHLVKSHSDSKSSYNKFRDVRPIGSVGFGLFSVIDYFNLVEWNESGNEITVYKILRKN